MKRGTPDHPKTRKLKRRLKSSFPETVGVIELLFHFTAQFAPQGDIGKWTNEEIADGVGWEGDPDGLVGALVDSGWVDPDSVHRMMVHDWSDHADNSVRTTLRNKGIDFLEPTPEVSGSGAKSGAEEAEDGGSVNPDSSPAPHMVNRTGNQTENRTDAQNSTSGHPPNHTKPSQAKPHHTTGRAADPPGGGGGGSSPSSGVVPDSPPALGRIQKSDLTDDVRCRQIAERAAREGHVPPGEAGVFVVFTAAEYALDKANDPGNPGPLFARHLSDLDRFKGYYTQAHEDRARKRLRRESPATSPTLEQIKADAERRAEIELGLAPAPEEQPEPEPDSDDPNRAMTSEESAAKAREYLERTQPDFVPPKDEVEPW
ncbi:MAG: hypothetical protein DHS20C21_02990 [Gemmatimonadota bacterium]|nr:MAG: hypothetical protein DHS20C21_02990 [Gemmatimonadota bacterium]